MEIPPSDARTNALLRPECVAIYEAQLKRIWWALIRTRESMHIVSRIDKFPLGRFVTPDKIAFFWRLLVVNCGNAVVLRLHCLLNDNERDTLSLRKWANSVCQWIRPEYLDWYREQLREAKFDTRLHDVAERVSKLRHDIAHILLDEDGTPAEVGSGVSDSEVEELYRATEKLFQTACLNHQHVIDIEEIKVGGTGRRPIDDVLDLVAKDSHWVNEPEKHEKWWPMRRQHRSPEELKELNEWRARFGLPPA